LHCNFHSKFINDFKSKDHGLVVSINATISQNLQFSKKGSCIPIFPPQENVSQLQSRKNSQSQMQKA
jgi:hypothetical protein